MPNSETLQSGYLIIAFASTVLYVLKLIIFSIFGGDTEISTDFDTICETDISFNFLTIESILAFLMGFGWLGLAGLVKWHVSAVISLLIAAVTGLIFMFLSAYLMFCVKKLDKKIKIDLNECVGKTGRTYTSFKPYSEGQIEIEINKQLKVIEAFNSTDEEIPSFEPIEVEKVENNRIYIVKNRKEK